MVKSEINDTGDELVALRSLSRHLNIACAWLKAEADAGRIPSIRAGRRRLFSTDGVKAALLERARRGEVVTS